MRKPYAREIKRTHCIRGHERTPATVNAKGACMTCKKKADKVHQQKSRRGRPKVVSVTIPLAPGPRLPRGVNRPKPLCSSCDHWLSLHDFNDGGRCYHRSEKHAVSGGRRAQESHAVYDCDCAIEAA